ncbi:hypothetical protein F5Y10DRAFT_261086 [Nemania abortiva]|nr:hypothetical protein F5Y10DRAFT_261086 [Nemania abortiva]
MFPTLARRFLARPLSAPKLRNPTRAAAPTGVYLNSRYKPKKVWPPDFSKLSQRDKFRLEKKYKRRVRLATARPRWDRFVRLARLGAVTFVIVYSFLIMEWNTEHQPFEGVRNSIWSALSVFSSEKRDERQRPDLPTTADQK